MNPDKNIYVIQNIICNPDSESLFFEAESRRGGVEKAAAESGVMKTQKFTWSKDGAKSFEWRKIYHALVGQVGPGEGGLLAEALITPTSMRTGGTPEGPRRDPGGTGQMVDFVVTSFSCFLQTSDIYI